MPDVWSEWDRLVQRSGQPAVAASELTDLEIVTLLASEDPHRRQEKVALKHEAYRRMVTDRAALATDAPRPPGAPAEGPRMDPL